MFGKNKQPQGNNLFDDDASSMPQSAPQMRNNPASVPPSAPSFMDDLAPRRVDRQPEQFQRPQQQPQPQSELHIQEMKDYASSGFIVDGVTVVKLKNQKYVVRSKKFNSEIDLSAEATPQMIGEAVIKFLTELSEQEKMSALDKLAHGEQPDDGRQMEFIAKSLGTIGQMIKDGKI